MAQLLSNLPIGAKVKSPNTKYNGVPIIWLIGHKTADRVKLITEKIITIKCFDGKEPTNPDSGRQQYGNNRYSLSNIDQWLNSAKGDLEWWTESHPYDEAPTVWPSCTDYNEYFFEAGFLANFEEAFRNAILDTTIRVAIPSVDGGGYEDITRKVYLLSETEVGLGNENGIAEGSKWDLFSDNNSRKAYPTAEAVNASNYKDAGLSPSKYWYWWLRTPHVSSSNYVKTVWTDGGLGWHGASLGNLGIRPALELSSSILVSNTTDTDGCYTIILWTPPNMTFDINNVKKAYDNGWCKINGSLKQIDKVWTKVDGVLRNV